LGEDNSDLIKVHPELNSVSSPPLCAGDRDFFKIFGREHANAPNITINASQFLNDIIETLQMQAKELQSINVGWGVYQ